MNRTDLIKIQDIYKQYNITMPEKGIYRRNNTRKTYFSCDFKDGEIIVLCGYCEKPSSNALGFAYFALENILWNTKLINVEEIELIKNE